MRAIGVDVGGTKVLGVVLDTEQPSVVLGETRVPTPRGAPALLDAIAEVVRTVGDDAGYPVGVGVPGLVDHGDRFRFGPNLPDVVDVDVGDELRERLGAAVVVDNDATCATLAEFSIGAGVGHDDGVLLTIGTGIGGGLVVDGRLRRGTNGFAGEPGHMVVDPNGPRCPCGRRGCWERFASGSGLGRLGRDAAIAGRLAHAVDLAGGTEAVRGEHVVAAARAGADGAGEVLDEFAWWMALGIANLVDVLDPGIVVLGGGVMDAADLLLDRVRRALAAQVVGAGHRPDVPVEAALAGERAGAVGAALAAAEAAQSA